MRDNDKWPFESSSFPVSKEPLDKSEETAARSMDELFEFINRHCPDCSYNPDVPEKTPDNET